MPFPKVLCYARDMENRYKDILHQYNGEILKLTPANQTLRQVLGIELSKLYKPRMRILEIGCGEGDSSKYILENFSGKLDLLDVSAEMIAQCKVNLKKYRNRIKYICADALEYLSGAPQYNLITTTWVLHNFLWKENQQLLIKIYEKLSPGGALLLMDKVYPGKNDRQLLQNQIERYDYLSDAAARRAIIEHERQDFSPAYRLDQKKFVDALGRLGFKNIRIVGRVERDVVLTAKK